MMTTSSDGITPAAALPNFMERLGERLIENGYPTLPILPGAKCPGRWTSQHGWQGYKDWTRHCDRPSSLHEWDIWRRWPGCAVGVACGRLAALDIDLLDQKLAEEIEARARAELGDTPLLRIGQAPKRLLVYRAKEPFKPIKRHPLELLAHGSQFVAYAIHPETKLPYAWPHESPEEVDVSRLPAVAEERARAFMDAAIELVPPELRQNRIRFDRGKELYWTPNGDLEGTPEAIEAALEFLPNADVHYDDWIKMGLAIKGALGEDGRRIWLGWSASSAKSGKSGKRDTAERKWRSFKDVRDIGAGSIYRPAMDAGWVPAPHLILNGTVARARAEVVIGGKLAGQAPGQAPGQAEEPTHDPSTGEVLETPLPVVIGEQYRDRPPRQMVVKGLLGVGELSVTYGAPKTGKSFLLTSVALAVACGDPDWFGHRIKRSGLVVYCIMEGTGGFPNRLAAWSAKTERPVPNAFAYVPVRLRFLADPPPRGFTARKAAATQDVARLKQTVAELEARLGAPCVLLVVDTVARAMTGRDENSTQDMGEFVDACAELQALPSRPHVALVHHESKSGNMRGSTALMGAGDVMIRVQKDGDERTWEVEMAKDDVDDGARAFALEQVEIGEDDDGEPITSAVVVDRGMAENKPRDKEVSTKDKILYTLHNIVAKHGVTPPQDLDIPAKYVASIDFLRGETVRLFPDEDKKKFDDTVKRTINRMVVAGELGRVETGSGKFVWFGDPTRQSAAEIVRSTKG